ncbi:MAG: 3'-5' exonuclease [Thermomicrobiales bacterium]
MEFTDLRRLQLDIETTGLNPEIDDNEVIIVSLRTSAGLERVLEMQSSEAELLAAVGEAIRELDPDVIEGHNLFNFDLPFLARRAARWSVDVRWGRDGSSLRIGDRQQRFKVGGASHLYHPAFIHGRHIIDTYQQIQRYDIGGRFTSYGLKPVIDALGLTADDRELVAGEDVRRLWSEDRPRLVRYALGDVRDVDTLARMTLPTEFYQTQLLPRSFQHIATMGTGTKINDLMIRAYLFQRESIPYASPSRDYPGGHAELLKSGVFSPVVKCDVESLYPSIMLQREIISARDSLDAYLPMLRELTRRRLEAKARSRETDGHDQAVWEGLQGSFKVLINSFYGYLGFGAGLFNDFDAAERVTLIGQDLIKGAVQRLNDAGAIPIEVDTDGVYFVPPPEIDSFDDELRFIQDIGRHFPEGVRLAHDGRYRAMLSIYVKTYALLTHDDRMILKGSALRSRRLEPCFRDFLLLATRGFVSGDEGSVRDAYFALGDRIRNRSLTVDEISQWAMIKTETTQKQPRLRRMLEQLQDPIRDGERLLIYERENGDLAVAGEYAQDENLPYLLRRLGDTAERFRAPFPSEVAFADFFPALSLKTDLDAARRQQTPDQMRLF